MQYTFLNIFLNPKELLLQVKIPVNEILLDNASSQIEKIYEFYKSNASLLYVNGFMGTGKAQVVNYSTTFLSLETIVLKYNCFNSTILDDLLLSFFMDFKKLFDQNILSNPKIKTENFIQKINSYFSQIDRPFVVIIDSFESLLDENRQEILDFIFHLNSMQKIKIIIIGRTFESKYFTGIELERVTTFAFERPIFERYLKMGKIKFSNSTLDDFYKYTRGYYFFTSLSITLIKNENLSLADFLTKVKKSFLPFADFLGRQALTLVSPSEKNLFWFLSTIRHPVSLDLLKKIKFYDEEKIKTLVENQIVIKDKSQFYIQDYLKDYADGAISQNISQKNRQYIIDLYLTQLPLSPLKRDICKSRRAMRKEIEYHKFFLPKSLKNIDNTPVDINYLSYATVLDFKDKKKGDGEFEDSMTPTNKIDLTQRKNISINLENLPFQSNPDESSSKIDEDNVESNKRLKTTEDEDLTLKELIIKAKQSEDKYSYSKAINLYKKALELKTEQEYKVFLPLIYTRLGHAYQEVASYENALKYYDLAQKYYEDSNDISKINLIKFKIAKIFYDTYKIGKAKKLFLNIAQSTQSSSSLVVKSYLQLANIEEGLSNQAKSFEYCELAISNSNESMDIRILSELYFKYALAMDDKDDVKKAIQFYLKCINLGDNVEINKFVSSSYSNIATLYWEKNDPQSAIENYVKAYKIDEYSNNLEGMYYLSSKLAPILQKTQPEEAFKYFQIAVDVAKSIKDTFYIVSASLALGDYFYDRKNDEFALKNYLFSLDLARNNFSKDNINKINIRINDIKLKLGIDKFEQLTRQIDKFVKDQNDE